VVIDAGVENIHIRSETEDLVIENNDTTKKLFTKFKVFDKTKDARVLVTGKLAEIVINTLGKGELIVPSAALWAFAKSKVKTNLGIIDLSASGYMVICVNKEGKLVEDLLVENPKCGAGSGINLNRILEKLDIDRLDVDKILKDYIVDDDKRKSVSVRSDRCGVFSSSATISDKNQGIPLDFALAVTLKSEVLKACKKMLPNTDTVYLTGRVFNWKYMRECAEDYLKGQGVKKILFNKEQSVLIEGSQYLHDNVKLRKQEKRKLKREKKLTNYPNFKELKKKYEKDGLYVRLGDPKISSLDKNLLKTTPINMGLDVGSTMAKMVISNAKDDELLFFNSYDNHGDTVDTIKHMFKDLGVDKLNIQHVGITGSGRYQVQKVLKEVYPHLGDRIFVLVENYAHAHGSFEYVKEHVKKVKNANIDFCVLVDIGGEDTKVSIISLKKEELYDNVMNIKCSAGTGSLMDTLKAMFSVPSIKEACRMAYEADKAYEINATCAVFLMENARKMQALGYEKDEILSSCNYAIVENMARTLWNQIDFPKDAVVLLHGQTMLSDPLPLAVTRRIQEKSKMYCLVPPMPGHRACIGLIKSIEKKKILDELCDLRKFVELKMARKMITCRGAACGDKDACCARTLLTAKDITLTLGGCTAVNELSGKTKSNIEDAYKDIWKFIDDHMPRSKAKKRLVIPRCFSVSEQAFLFSKILGKLGIDVYVDNVIEADVLKAQPIFNIDVCAPLIGATGQFIRLAKEEHGMILVPQIDFLSTNNTSKGRTCTTNQGGVVIAMRHALLKHPKANFFLFDINMSDMSKTGMAYQLFEKLKGVFKFYDVDVSEKDMEDAVEYGLKENQKLKKSIGDKAAYYVEYAIKNKLNMSIVCGREYILNPGLYDSHVGKLLKDKRVVALPSYVFDSELDKRFSYLYWRNPHDITTKVHAITNKSFHKILKNEKLGSAIKKVEKGLTDTLISVAQISTFRCGPDTVTLPTSNEITKNVPSLFIQSDAMIKELAHLENRVNTHINQLNKKLHEEFPKENFSVEVLDDFGFEKLNKDTDVIYFPTLQDNRSITSILRGAGIACIDNFDDETFDLEEKVRYGRRYAGDSVCAPLAAVLADIMLAADDFRKRKKSGDKLVKGKKRILVFDNKGTGPCRQGQYYEQHKLYLHKRFGANSNVGLVVGHEKDGYNIGLDEWIAVQSFQGAFIKAILHGIFLKGGAGVKNYEEFQVFQKEFNKFRDKLYEVLGNTKPSKAWLKILKLKKPMVMMAIMKYFAYGLHNNNGMRKIIRKFSNKWIKPNKTKMKIHVEGEAYMRVAQIRDIFDSVVDSVGFGAAEVSYSPLWCYLDVCLEYGMLNFKEEIERYDAQLKETDDKEELLKLIKKKKKMISAIKYSKKLVWSLFIRPLYKAAKLDAPHQMSHILEKTKKVLPTIKPRGELPAYVGEAIVKAEEGTDLFLNVAPEGCMVSSMGQAMTQPIMDVVKNKSRIEGLFTLNGEVNDEQLRMYLLKTLGPEKFYAENA